jgi:predicted transcriptional regulator
MSDTTSVKLRDGLKDRLRAIAEDDQRSVNWLMNAALEEYAERREKRKALREELSKAHRQYIEGGRLHLTHDEVVEWMRKRRLDRDAPIPKLHK